MPAAFVRDTARVAPRLTLEASVTVADVSGSGALCLNNTSYLAVLGDDLLAVCADLGSVRVLMLNADLPAVGVREVSLTTPGRAAVPTIVTRAGPLELRRGNVAAVACTVQDSDDTRVIMFVCDKDPSRPLHLGWSPHKIVSGTHTDCDSPSLSFESTKHRYFVAYAVATDGDGEAYIVELDLNGNPRRGPTLLGRGKAVSVAAHDGIVVVSWKRRIDPDVNSDLQSEVVGLYWSIDDWPPGDETAPGWVPRVIAGPSSTVDTPGQAKDPCTAVAGDNGRFWVTYDKATGEPGVRDIGVVELFAGDFDDWRYNAVELEAQGKDATFRDADFAFGRSVPGEGGRLVVWEARDAIAAYLAYATGSSSGRAWHDERPVIGTGTSDLLFPTSAVTDGHVYLAWLEGRADAGALVIAQGRLSTSLLSGTP